MIDSAAFQGKKAKYFTLGCKLNFSETSTFGKMLSEMGVVTARKDEQADICLINTCSVTDVADHKCRQAIHRLVRENPAAFVVVTGCYAQLEPETISKIEGVDLVLGSNEKANLIQFLSEGFVRRDNNATYRTVKTKDIKTFAPSCSRGNRTRYFLKVQDGCDYFCAYCTIPFARGRSRNPSIAECVEQVKSLAADGMKEVIISGVNIGDFGKTTGENFLQLLEALAKVDGIERYRIGSIEPDLLTDEIIEFVASEPKMMPHFHIPLQSGCDELLKLIGRRYDTALYRRKIELVKKLIPDTFIGIDLIVGVNGETSEMFEETLKFVDSLDISFIHQFQYSERENTRALKFTPRVTSKQKQERADVVKTVCERKHHEFVEKNLGSVRSVLFESAKKGGQMFGYTDNYIRVAVPYDKDLVNRICPVKLTKVLDDDIVEAEILK